MPSESLFLGFDLSTQQLKIIVTTAELAVLKTYSVGFDDQFKEKYGIRKGVRANGSEILSPVHMWLDAVDYLFGEMKKDGVPFDKVRGLSGSGMQHGLVYWSKLAPEALEKMDPKKNLSLALDDAFAWDMSPNWQDHSTGQEIADFEKVAGGPDKLAERTGSRAHYRFTGLQIRKLAVRAHNGVYERTERISLVSSFLASVLLGRITEIELADACGMNVYDFRKGDYDDELVAVAAGVHPDLDKKESKEGVEELKRKLGPVNPVSFKALGAVLPYFHKYGFTNDAKVYSFTGDNLATIILLPLQQNDILVSLGTSTTVLLVTEQYRPSQQYHLFRHPTIPKAYMGMICYCNGALAREKVRDAVNEKHGEEHDSWDRFDQLLDESTEFDRRLGIYFPLGEIVPNAAAQFKRSILRENHSIEDVDEWDAEEDVSSIVESQTISARMRAGPMLSSGSHAELSDENKDLYAKLHEAFGDLYTDGKKQTAMSLTARPRKVFFVGGASKNKSIIRKMASILGATEGNYQVEIPNACALGGAYKASWSRTCEEEGKIGFNDYLEKNFDFDEVQQFDVDDKWANYFPAMGLLAKMEETLKHD